MVQLLGEVMLRTLLEQVSLDMVFEMPLEMKVEDYPFSFAIMLFMVHLKSVSTLSSIAFIAFGCRVANSLL